MTRKERVSNALKHFDFYQLAKITMEENMKKNIKVTQADDYELLERHGNKFFTHEQVKELQEV